MTLQSLLNLRGAVAGMTRGAAPRDHHLVSWKKEDNDVPITDGRTWGKLTNKKVFQGKIHPRINIYCHFSLTVKIFFFIQLQLQKLTVFGIKDFENYFGGLDFTT